MPGPSRPQVEIGSAAAVRGVEQVEVVEVVVPHPSRWVEPAVITTKPAPQPAPKAARVRHAVGHVLPRQKQVTRRRRVPTRYKVAFGVVGWLALMPIGYFAGLAWGAWLALALVLLFAGKFALYAVAALVAFVLSLFGGDCPGIHCTGCSQH